MDSDKPKYSLVMLFDKAADISALKRIASAAKAAKWGDKPPAGLRSPFRDGDEKEGLAGYAGMTFVKASTKFKPDLVDKDRQPIIGEDEFYAGCWARCSLTAYAYDFQGNKGVAFNLHNVQKLQDDDPFVGKLSAEDEFSDGETASQDADQTDEW
jgi:hypothetical protein